MIVALALSATSLSAGETYLLKATKADNPRHLSVVLDVDGQLKLNADGKKVTRTALKVHGEMVYDERLKLPASLPESLRAMRLYEKADATIYIGGTEFKTALQADRCLIALQKTPNETAILAADGPLTRDQLELLDTPAGRVSLSELLPDKTVKIDETWDVAEELLTNLLCIDSITESTVKGTLQSVKAGVATVQFSGNLTGAVAGIVTEIQLKAKYQFHLKSSQVTWLGMAIREDRAVGHAEPGFETVTKVAITASPAENPANLSDAALAKVKLDAEALPLLVHFKAVKTGFQLLLDRRWRVLTDRTDMTVLRFVGRGELIAQCNVSILPDLPAGKQVSIDELQADIKQSLDTNFREFLEASQSATDDGLRVLRVVAAGEASELPIHWIYYLISNDQGQRAAFVFTLEAKLTETFAAADRIVTSTFQFGERTETESPAPSAPKLEAPTAAKPAVTEKR